MKKITILTKDNVPLVAHVFEPELTNRHQIVVVNTATGVRQHLYFGIAKYLSKLGFTVITYDYRGVGLSKPSSLKDFKASMRIWGRLDFKAITDYVKTQYSGYSKHIIGHSVGALILAMNKETKNYTSFVFIATQNAQIRHLKFKIKFISYFGFRFIQPLLTRIFGYFPAHWVGLGESLPAGVGYDWRTLILHPKSINQLLTKGEKIFASSLYQDALVISAEDDGWVTTDGMNALMLETYPLLKPHYREVKKKESEKGKIGHIDFFRNYNHKLWNIIADELSRQN